MAEPTLNNYYDSGETVTFPLTYIMQIRAIKKRRVVSDEAKAFILSNYTECSNIELGKCTQLPVSSVHGFLKRNGLIRKRRLYYIDPELKEMMGKLLEDYFMGQSAVKLSEKYKVSQGTISRFVSMMFFKKLDDDTEVIVMESKV